MTLIGTGPDLQAPFGLAVEADGRLVVVEGFTNLAGGPRRVVRVDPHTGDRTVVANDTTGHGPPLVFPESIAVERDGHLVVVDGFARFAGLRAVVRVDPHTGDRTIVSQ